MRAALLIVSMVMLCLYSKSQPIEKYKLPLNADSNIVYDGIVQLDSSYSSQSLYSSVKTWFVNSFVSSKAVIQSEDPISGRFLGKFNIPGFDGLSKQMVIGNTCEVYVQIDVKNGKYRYKFYGLNGTVNLFGTLSAIDVNLFYRQYLNETIRRGALTNKQSVYKKCFDVYQYLDNRMNSIIASLNISIKNSKSDTF